MAAGFEELCGALERRGAGEARVALVLGSGLGAFSASVADAEVAPYEELEGMPRSAVPGHAGRAVIGDVAGVRVCVLEGRVHRYEGWSVEEVTRGVRALAALGVPALLLTNAAGGIVKSWRPPLLMRVTDHIDLQADRLRFPERGLHAGTACASMARGLQVGARAHRREIERGDRGKTPGHDATRATNDDDTQDSSPYDPAVGRALELAAREAGTSLFHGIYAGLLGPTYETPAEVRMLRWMGADAVGMSTVAEAAAAHAAGMRVGAVSCITNPAAGLTRRELSHEEVVAAGAQVAEELCALLTAAIPGVGEVAAH